MKNNKIFRWQDMGGNFFNNALLRFKLIIRLLKDQRINSWLKIIPVFSLAYLVMPLDIPGPLDDALVLWFGVELFIELCPAEIVKEHLNRLQNKEKNLAEEPAQTVIDADFKEIKKDD